LTSKLGKLGRFELIGVLSVYGLALFEADLQISSAYPNCVSGTADKMHFYAAKLLVIERSMFELPQVKVAA
jgi:hypothetical protein